MLRDALWDAPPMWKAFALVAGFYVNAFSLQLAALAHLKG